MKHCSSRNTLVEYLFDLNQMFSTKCWIIISACLAKARQVSSFIFFLRFVMFRLNLCVKILAASVKGRSLTKISKRKCFSKSLMNLKTIWFGGICRVWKMWIVKNAECKQWKSKLCLNKTTLSYYSLNSQETCTWTSILELPKHVNCRHKPKYQVKGT